MATIEKGKEVEKGTREKTETETDTKHRTIFILFPHQLFSLNEIPKQYQTSDTRFILVEHPVFFGSRKKMKMNFQKKKIVLHRASCLEYVDEMRDAGIRIAYIDLESFNRTRYLPLLRIIGADGDGSERYSVVCFDPVDYELVDELGAVFRDRLTIIETPNFLTHTAHLIEFYESHLKHSRKGATPDHFFHATFYKWQVDHLSIPHIKRSYDTENREAIPDSVEVPTITEVTGIRNRRGSETGMATTASKHLAAAIRFCNHEFPRNYGTTDGFYLPTTRKAANEWLHRFVQDRLTNFGKYQDALIPGEPFLFHSVISPMLNIGLISPFDVVREAIAAYKKHKVSIEAYEGFLRQVVGWREYQRFIYLFLYNDIVKSNHFGHGRSLTRHWYNGTTGLAPLDDAIRGAFKWGYLHHIQRLMVVSNAMNLCEIEPHQAYKWFMEFAVDSYDWVMIGNVYSMGMWADGGLTMRKPYFSSDKYIQGMAGGRYPAGEWEDQWRALYYRFLSKHATKLRGTPYVRNLVHWNRMAAGEKREIGETAKEVIERITR